MKPAVFMKPTVGGGDESLTLRHPSKYRNRRPSGRRFLFRAQQILGDGELGGRRRQDAGAALSHVLGLDHGCLARAPHRPREPMTPQQSSAERAPVARTRCNCLTQMKTEGAA